MSQSTFSGLAHLSFVQSNIAYFTIFGVYFNNKRVYLH